MAQVKLIETEKPQTFNPVTIQVTFETQEELNAWYEVLSNYKTAYDAATKEGKLFKSTAYDFSKSTKGVYDIISKHAK